MSAVIAISNVPEAGGRSADALPASRSPALPVVRRRESLAGTTAGAAAPRVLPGEYSDHLPGEGDAGPPRAYASAMEDLAAAWRRWLDSPARDVVLALVVTFVLVLGAYSEGHPNQTFDVNQFPHHSAPHPTAALTLVAVAGLALAWRRRYPLTVLAVSVTAATEMASTATGQRRRQASTRQATATRSSAAVGCGTGWPRNWTRSAAPWG